MAGFDVNYTQDVDADLMGRAFGPDDTLQGIEKPVIPGADGGMPPADPPADPPAPPANTNTEPPAAPPAAPPADPAPPAPVPFDFEGISNGLVKGPEDITRIATENARLLVETQQLKEQIAKDPFANDFVKSLSQMYADSKSPEQIDTFIKLQKLGDISKLTPMEAMIEARVLRSGHDPDLVRKSIERKHGITPDMDDETRKIIDLDLADEAKSDYEYLATQKKELAIPAPTTPDPNVLVISKEVISAQVAPLKERIKGQFTSLGEINLNAKYEGEGDKRVNAKEAIVFNLPIPKSFQDRIPALADDFFTSNGIEVNQQNLTSFMEVVNVELFKAHGVELIQSCVNHALADLEPRIRAEYENTNGIPPKTGVTRTDKKTLDAIAENAVYQSIARGEE